MEIDTNTLTLRHPWIWGIPTASFAAMLAVLLAGINQTLFLGINQASELTGDGLWANLTILGDALVALALLSPFVGRRPEIVWAAMLAALLAGLWVHSLKPLLDIPRPAAVLPKEMVHIIGPLLRAGAFPSGHSTTAFTIAAVIGLQYRRPWIIAPLTVLALVAGLSRAVVGVHWPLDVLGGAFGGWLAAVGGIFWARRWRWGLTARAQRIFALLLVTAATLLLFHDTGYPQAHLLKSLIAITCLFFALPKLVRSRSHG